MRPPAPDSPGVLDIVRASAAGTLDADRHLRELVSLADTVEPWLHAFAHRPAVLAPVLAGTPLGGVPVGVKDIIATADMPTGHGSPLHDGQRPTQDAAVVRRLRERGGIVFGKTVTTEFAWRHPGPTVNPFGRLHTPGGSSSGSAASVAAGIVPLALGTQTLGSIIRPAAFCGVVGLKPSFGTIDRAGVHPLAGSLDHLGLFTRSVDDAAYALSLLADENSFAVDPRLGLLADAPPRLLLVRTAQWQDVGAEQQALLAASARRLVDAGAMVADADLPEAFAPVPDLLHVVLAVEAAANLGDHFDRHPERISAPLRQLVAEGRTLSSASYAHARAAQSALREALDTMLRGFDALLLVPAPGAAPLGLAHTGDGTFCAPWSFTGAPAIALPAGWSRDGLPLGLQLVAAWRQDLRLLRAAKWAEQVLRWRGRRLDVSRPPSGDQNEP